MIRGKLPIGADYFHVGIGRWMRKTNRGWVRRSIAVMEEKLGHRINSRIWHVHHRNRDKTNDTRKNLQLKRARKHISDHRRGHQDSAGVKNGNAKITPKEVHRVIALAKLGKLTQREIGQRVGLSQPCVHRIIHGTAWKTVKR